MFIFSWFRMYIKKLQSSQNNPDKSYYIGKDCIEELCKKLKENAMEITNHEKKRNNTINQ